METRPALQNIQDAFLNMARRERSVVLIYLLYGAKLSGRIKSFDKFSLILESGSQELLVFKHAISTIQHTRGTVSDESQRSELHSGSEVVQSLQDLAPAIKSATDANKQVDS